MKNITIFLIGILFFIPSVSSASTLTQDQVNAIISVLNAFGVAQSVIDTVAADLAPAAPETSISAQTVVQTLTLGSVSQGTPISNPPYSILFHRDAGYEPTFSSWVPLCDNAKVYFEVLDQGGDVLNTVTTVTGSDGFYATSTGNVTIIPQSVGDNVYTFTAGNASSNIEISANATDDCSGRQTIRI